MNKNIYVSIIATCLSSAASAGNLVSIEGGDQAVIGNDLHICQTSDNADNKVNISNTEFQGQLSVNQTGQNNELSIMDTTINESLQVNQTSEQSNSAMISGSEIAGQLSVNQYSDGSNQLELIDSSMESLQVNQTLGMNGTNNTLTGSDVVVTAGDTVINQNNGELSYTSIERGSFNDVRINQAAYTSNVAEITDANILGSINVTQTALDEMGDSSEESAIQSVNRVSFSGDNVSNEVDIVQSGADLSDIDLSSTDANNVMFSDSIEIDQTGGAARVSFGAGEAQSEIDISQDSLNNIIELNDSNITQLATIVQDDNGSDSNLSSTEVDALIDSSVDALLNRE